MEKRKEFGLQKVMRAGDQVVRVGEPLLREGMRGETSKFEGHLRGSLET